MLSQRYPEAIKEFQNAISVEPNNYLAHHNLGVVYMSIDRLNLAESSVRRALELNSKFTQAQNTLAKIFIEKKQYDKAVRLAMLTLQDLTYTGVDTSYENLGVAYLKKGKNKTAQFYLRKAILKNDKNCAAFFYYGLALFHDRSYQHGLSVFKKTEALCQKQGFQEPRYYAGLSLLKLGRKYEARNYFEKIIKEAPESRYASKARRSIELTKE